MKPIQQLEQLAQRAAEAKFPTIPPHLLAPRKFKNTSKANGLTKAIIAYITLTGGQAERVSTEGRVIQTKRSVPDYFGGGSRVVTESKRIPTSGKRGSADISATIKDSSGVGRSVKIEVKIGRDKQSDKQVQYQKDVERAGGIYYIARDFDSFFAWYNEFTGKPGR
jgi:hypothetical protein